MNSTDDPPPKRKRGRPAGTHRPSKYGFEKLAPGESHDVPYDGPNTANRILAAARSWAKSRGIPEARFATMTYRTAGIVRIAGRR